MTRALLVLALLCAPRVALGQEDLDAQRFHPAVTSGGSFVVEGSSVRQTLDPWSFALWAAYGYDPLVFVDADGEIQEHLVRSQMGLDLIVSVALFQWLELGLDVPFGVQSGDHPQGGSISALSLGDLRLVPKIRFLDDRRAGIGLALVPELRVPTHTGDYYGGARMVVFAPRLVVDHAFRRSGVRIGLNVGTTLREATDLGNVHAGSEFTAALGLGWRFDRGRSPVELALDGIFALGLEETDSEETALEVIGGVRIDPHPDWALRFGAGIGVLEGWGVPLFRVLAGIRWEPTSHDRDRDGVSDDRDTCPEIAEDLDGFEDDDGCPEGDDDRDGVLDQDDLCPDEAEMINGFEDDDGCPDEGPARVIIEEGQIRILENIEFESGSDRLAPESDSILNQIVLTMRAHPEVRRVRIEGHTDDTGPRDMNMSLSRRRAASVRRYLVQHGIEQGRLEAEGYGPDRPIEDNSSESGRAANRRVQFVILPH